MLALLVKQSLDKENKKGKTFKNHFFYLLDKTITTVGFVCESPRYSINFDDKR